MMQAMGGQAVSAAATGNVSLRDAGNKNVLFVVIHLPLYLTAQYLCVHLHEPQVHTITQCNALFLLYLQLGLYPLVCM